jgi:hypothetical protein
MLPESAIGKPSTLCVAIRNDSVIDPALTNPCAIATEVPASLRWRNKRRSHSAAALRRTQGLSRPADCLANYSCGRATRIGTFRETRVTPRGAVHITRIIIGTAASPAGVWCEVVSLQLLSSQVSFRLAMILFYLPANPHRVSGVIAGALQEHAGQAP